jgi:hypothetical protein
MIFEKKFNWSLLNKARDISVMKQMAPSESVVSKIPQISEVSSSSAENGDSRVPKSRGMRVTYDPTVVDNGARRCREWLTANGIRYTLLGRYHAVDHGMRIEREFVGAVFDFEDEVDAFHFHLAFGGVMS